MKTNLKVTQDLLKYIKHLDTISKVLKPKQKKELENILRTLMIILVALKKGTDLGKVKFNWEE